MILPGTPLDWAAPLQRWCPGPCSLFRCLGRGRGWPWSRSGEHLLLWSPDSAAWPALLWWCLEDAAPMWENSRGRGLGPPPTEPGGEPPPAQHSGCGTADWIWFQTCCYPKRREGGSKWDFISTPQQNVRCVLLCCSLSHTHTLSARSHSYAHSLPVYCLQVTAWLTAFPQC